MTKEINFLNLRAAIELDETFNILKEKYKDIEVDLLSWRENPSCSCGQRVHEYFNKVYNTEDANFLDEMFKNEKVQEKIKEITKPRQVRRELSTPNSGQIPQEMTDYRGKIFVVGKTDEDWANFWKKIIEDRAAYRSFSVSEKEEYIKVYFL